LIELIFVEYLKYLIMINATFYESFLLYYKKYIKHIFIFCVFSFITFQTLPNLIYWPSAGLDSSWVVGINMASAEKMQFGKDIVFTFGPLGFLYQPLFYEFNLWCISVTFSLFVHIFLVFMIYLLLRKLSTNIFDVILIAIVFMFALPFTFPENKLIFSIIILSFVLITERYFSKYQFLICLIISFLMAVCSLLKFTSTLISISIILFMIIYFIYKKRFNYIFWMSGTYIGFVLLLLYLTGQSISNFPSYILNSLEISSGYNSAMSLNGPRKEVLAGLCVLGLLFVIFVDSILKKKQNLVLFILLNAGYIFISFKHGYIRHDGHVYLFFSNILSVLLVISFMLKGESRKILQHSSFVLICVLIGFMYSKYPHLLVPNVKQKYQNICSAVSVIKASPLEREKTLENVKSKMRETYGLDKNTLEYINGKSLNMLPWEIALPYAYNMNWSPMPVFQSYSAYTPKLDLINAGYFEGNASPEILLYSTETIDGRYHIYDTPETFRMILNNYEPVLIDKTYLLLEKRDKPIPVSQELVSALDAKIGEPILIPKIDEGLIFAKIYMDYNLAGKILNILFKAPEARIKLKSGEKEYNHRFIFSNARDGIFLSQYISNEEELKQIWTDKPLNNLDSFTISVENESFYNKNIYIEFFQVKSINSAASLDDNKGF
jgi:hypothetical protein